MSTIDTEINLKEVVKAILFVAGEGVEKSLLAEKLDVPESKIEYVLSELKKEYSGDNGIHIITYKDKVQLTSNPNYATQISDTLSPVREKSLTRAALETLAIIAYKQPITKLEIEDVRRVNSDYAVQALIDQDMIEIVGRKDAVGRPLMFGTTENFLKRFNISDVKDLPDYDELIERIKLIRDEEDSNKSDTLFKNTDDINFDDEEVPEFLKDEDFIEKVDNSEE
jgi:segregation and condensation protein B